MGLFWGKGKNKNVNHEETSKTEAITGTDSGSDQVAEDALSWRIEEMTAEEDALLVRGIAQGEGIPKGIRVHAEDEQGEIHQIDHEDGDSQTLRLPLREGAVYELYFEGKDEAVEKILPVFGEEIVFEDPEKTSVRAGNQSITLTDGAINVEKAKGKFALLLAEKEGITYKQARSEMLKLKWATGLSFADYYKNDMHNLDEHVRFRTAEKIVMKKARGRRYAEEISEILGVEIDEIWAEVKRLRELYQDTCSITTAVYHDYEFYRKDEDAIREATDLLARRKTICDGFREIYENELEYDDHIEELERIYSEIKEVNEKLMTKTLVDRYREEFAIRYPQAVEDEATAKDIVLDFLTLRAAAGYKDTDYIIYDLYPKTLTEKLAFASAHEMGNVVRKINAPETRSVLDDKYGCYKKFKEFFGRDIVSIKKLKDVTKNKEFFSNHGEFVKKPVFAKQGSGIRKITVKDYESIEAMGKSILKEDGAFIAEELIKGHHETAEFNEDSLNTFRIVTVNTGRQIPGIDKNNEAVERGLIHYAGNGIYCCAAFFKTGRKGSFVDNAGAGGCFTSIDLNRGVCSSIAIGEDGSEYTTHPDTGIRFDSLKIKNKHKLIATAKKLALMIPEAGIVGWDFALNDKGKWVLIEANFSPTFIGQAPAKYGIRREIHRMIFSPEED